MASDRLLPGDLAPIQVVLAPGSIVIRLYHVSDKIWNLPVVEQQRRALMDTHIDIREWAKRNPQEQAT